MEKLRSVLVTDRTQADVNAKNDKGTYNYTDLNRVLRACAWLAGRLEQSGYGVPFDYYKACLTFAKAQPENGGVAYGALGYNGETVTVRAVPAEKFEFQGWIESGQTVSLDQAYSFTADRDRELTALFEPIGSGADGVVGIGRIGLARIGIKGA